MIRFRVWANTDPMGWFGHEAAQYFFQYDAQWLSDASAFVLAPQFALREEPYRGELVKIFFANLLPEGVPLDEILNAMALRDANTFEMIGTLGADLPGVLSVLPEGREPKALQKYTELSKEELSHRILGRGSLQPFLTSNVLTRMSLAGAQDKLGVRYDERRGVMYDGIDGAPTTHIVKPDSRLAKYQPSAINEYLCMTLAHAMKLPVPRVSFLQVPESLYVVERYDRTVVNGAIVCLHQMDGCQLLGVGGDWKYERQGAIVSLKKIVAALRRLPISGQDLLHVQRWVMFNYLIGNSDAHAKNLSLMISAKGYTLAPFYDLLSVQTYGDNDLALYIGDEHTFATVGAHSWEAFAEDCGFGVKPTLSLFRKMAQDIYQAWSKTLAGALNQYQLSPSELKLTERMTAVIDANRTAALSMTAG